MYGVEMQICVHRFVHSGLGVEFAVKFVLNGFGLAFVFTVKFVLNGFDLASRMKTRIPPQN